MLQKKLNPCRGCRGKDPKGSDERRNDRYGRAGVKITGGKGQNP